MKELQQRKKNRLDGYDYSASGAYFVTICAINRYNVFWDNEFFSNVGANCVRPLNGTFVEPEILLSEAGEIVRNEILQIKRVYQNVVIDQFCIMPDHIHLIIQLDGETDGRTQFAPTLSRIIKQFKGAITKKLGYSVWQKSFYEHVIRDEEDYWKIAEYIQSNPLKFFVMQEK